MHDVESTRQLLHNLREKDRRISSTVHASVLLMLTQKYLREFIDHPLAGVDEASGQYFVLLVQFKRMFMDNGMFDSETLDYALQVYESFHVLEALPSRWSAQHLFKCNCSTCFQYASCPHALLESIVCDAKIEVPLPSHTLSPFRVLVWLGCSVNLECQETRLKWNKNTEQKYSRVHWRV